MKVGDMVRIKWTYEIQHSPTGSELKQMAVDNTPLIITDLYCLPTSSRAGMAVVVAPAGIYEIKQENLTTRMW